MGAFAVTAALALLTHYFAVFLLIGMVLWLLWDPRTRRAALPAIGALVIVGAALLPLISAQGGHGTQWIGRWPLSQRLQAIPQYYLTGYTGSSLGHGVELLVALPILAGLAFGLWRMTEPQPASRPPRPRYAPARRGLLIALSLAACGILIPISAIAVAFLAISIDVDLSPRLQRGNWRDVAKALRGAPRERAITTVELGSAPLEYYLPGLHDLREGSSVRVSEIDETGYAPLRAGAEEAPAPRFRLLARLDIDGLIVYRFVSTVPRLVSEAALRRHVITLATPEVLVPSGSHVSS
jgi:hypothetical protein